ncbi:hypothetical protein GRI89_16130 [Altererythrobacter salegens]|uniref:Uncharacterized protein n=1 Tax=Croceibacterium salegens TaxID=1737568 RepID=A0A6I4T309_9SPHN|nr:hypothetical protein [Croceibacterium salegens]MXO61072.1 hypothetical protein [Croceibacterium salegens]
MSPLRLFALSALAAAALAAPAAAGSTAYYQAELTAPVETAKFVAGGLVWNCDGTSCSAGKDTSRPLFVCRKLAKETSAVVRFSADGQDLSTEDLARCNG